MGILAEFLGFIEQNVRKLGVLELAEVEDDDIEHEAMGTCKQFAMANLFKIFVKLGFLV